MGYNVLQVIHLYLVDQGNVDYDRNQFDQIICRCKRKVTMQQEERRCLVSSSE
jgi:hypothetical protein